QHLAQGTSLALMVPPIGLIAAWAYFKQGYVDLKIASFIIMGFLAGSYIGAQAALVLPSKTLAKIFGIMMIGVGIHLIIKNR
ncbi:MAG TPA: sulfite exporter TauE/SafE family protein, partial [Candidatus Nitrosotenuis sp.]|nr:sulfite exporter TauE/SafE family protein [Candidatus Nitrosotenuis sp.]